MDSVYSEDFAEADLSATSAEVVVPLTLKYFPARTVVDVGCGVGAWLREFERHGISDYLGLDGAYVPTHLLQIQASRFRATDLDQLTDIGRSFDLAISLEVGEHLSESCAEQFVSTLVRSAPAVLFSAAVPGQGGTLHVNEQWQSYWANLFSQHNYICVDCIRPFIFSDERVQWWYRQNTVIYCQRTHCPAGFEPVMSVYDLDRIHPAMFSFYQRRWGEEREMLMARLNRQPTGRKSLAALLGALRR